MMSENKWAVEDSGQPDYLDGIMAQYLVYDGATAPVAYCFDNEQAHIIAAALDMMEALEVAEKLDWRDDCPECEGEDEPERCGICCLVADEARRKRRAALAKIQVGRGKNDLG